MTNERIPLTDLRLQHQPIAAELEDTLQFVLQRGDFILGETLAEFETAFARACHASYGVGVASGTDAIALGLRSCGIGEGDRVLVPANTFVATLIGILQVGALPVLVDCDPETALMDLTAAEKAITANTRAILPVHLYGQMVSPTRLLDLASTYDLLIFEDAAQSPLAEREGYRAGTVGVAAAFSFYPSKNLGALGDGGMVVTRDVTIAQKVRLLRNYGSLQKNHHTELGVNSRLDTLQAAVLSTKLPYLPGWNSDRNRLARLYDTLLQPLAPAGIVPIQNHCGSGHVYHLYVIRVTAACSINRDTLRASLEERSIGTGIHYPVPCHLQPAFHSLGYRPGDCPHAETLSGEVLSLPMYPGLQSAQVQRVVETIATQVGISLPKGSAEFLPVGVR